MNIKNTSLIKELKEISYQYLDPVSYLKVIGKTPEKFDEKLYHKILDNYDKSLKFYMTAHKESIELINRIQLRVLDGKKRIDPIYVSCLMQGLYARYGNFLLHDEGYYIREVTTYIEQQYQNIISYTFTIICFIVDKKLVNKIKMLDIEIQKELIMKGCQILRNTNDNIYDTTYYSQYHHYLEPVLWELIEKQGL